MNPHSIFLSAVPFTESFDTTFTCSLSGPLWWKFEITFTFFFQRPPLVKVWNHYHFKLSPAPIWWKCIIFKLQLQLWCYNYHRSQNTTFKFYSHHIKIQDLQMWPHVTRFADVTCCDKIHIFDLMWQDMHSGAETWPSRLPLTVSADFWWHSNINSQSLEDAIVRLVCKFCKTFSKRGDGGSNLQSLSACTLVQTIWN